MRLDDGRMFQFEVLHVASKSSLLRLTGPAEGQDRLVGRGAEVLFESQTVPPQTADKSKETAIPDQPAPGQSSTTPEDKEFVPLLAPVSRRLGLHDNTIFSTAVLDPWMIQPDSGGGHEYLRSLFDSSGSVERIKGTGWSFRVGRRPVVSRRRRHAIQPRLPGTSPGSLHGLLSTPPGRRGISRRGGRFLPHELPAVGYVDGFQGEKRWTDHVRAGVLAGLKPGRQDLAASVDEPMAGAYTTVEAGRRDGRYYSGTVGLLGSLYNGSTDRLSVLLDQRAGTGPLLTVYSTAEVDLDVGSAQNRTGTRLTRLDLSPVSTTYAVPLLKGGYRSLGKARPPLRTGPPAGGR